MLLLFDIGNTNIVVGLHDFSTLRNTWRVRTDANRTADEYSMIFKNFLQEEGLGFDAITGIMVSSVVPEMQTIITTICERKIKVKPLFVGAGIKTGIHIKVDEPRNAGADLIVSAVATHKKYGGPAIIVDFGTATTITVVMENGDYLGGAIIPGIELSSKALFGGAAKIPSFRLEMPPRVIGRSTEHAVQSGLIFGYASLVDGMIERMRLELELPDCKVITTGGQANIIAPASKHIKKIDPFLLLDGLKFLYDMNN